MTPRQSAHRRERDADPAAPPRARRGARERKPATQRIGTTKRGIGPAYEDKVGRRAIRVIDLQDLEALPAKIERLLAHHNRAAPRPRRSRRSSADDAVAIDSRHRAAGAAVCRSGLALLDEAGATASAFCSRGRKARCSTSTTAPIPSSPRPTPSPAQAATGSGLGPRAISYVLGITKAYTTRVGEGPFPTELQGRDRQASSASAAHEFGTVTGRPRRCGWFDAVPRAPDASRSAASTASRSPSSTCSTASTEIKICVGYARRPRDRLSAGRRKAQQARVEPIYETLEGWQDSTRGRAHLGRASRPRHQICSPPRGADRGAGGAALDEPRARGHHPRA